MGSLKHFGDITKISGFDLPIVDCITGGSPCQDLSIAGQRRGLDGERSGLFLEQIRIVKEMRENDIRTNKHLGRDVRPRWLVWENVQGALSSNGGEDFRTVLEEICKIADPSANVPRPAKKWSKSGGILGDGWSVAWRVHDAQFWGVPQRRERISVVADFGAESAFEVLFERVSLSGDNQQSGETREETARATSDGTSGTNFTFKLRGGAEVDSAGRRAGKGVLMTEEMSGTIGAVKDVFCLQGNQIDQAETSVCNGSGWKEEESYTLNTRDRHAIAFRKQGHPMNKEQGQNYEETEKSDTLNVFDNSEARTPTLVLENQPHDSRVKIKEDGIFQTLCGYMGTGGNNVPMVMEDALCIGNGQANQSLMTEQAGTLNTMHDAQAILSISSTNSNPTYSENVSSPIINRAGTGGGNSPMVASSSVVRRLTPKECERLQGFPDDWTNIGDWIDSKGKKRKCSDSARYKSIGNSIACPFWFWLLRRISAQYYRTATLGSLFDGIGGFPYCWERCNGKGSAVWASEIEEFCIAVTKKRFPDEEDEISEHEKES